MRLTDPVFEARLIALDRSIQDGSQEKTCATLDGAQAVRLRCPCGSGEWLSIGFANPRGVPQESLLSLVDGNTHQPIFWQMSGSGLHDLSLSPSVDKWKFKSGPNGAERDGSCWHGFITNGEVR